MRYFIFDKILTATQNHWSTNYTKADFSLCAIFFLQDLITYKSSEEVNKSIILSLGNSNKNTPKPTIDTSNMLELINQFKNLILTYLESRSLIIYRNYR